MIISRWSSKSRTSRLELNDSASVLTGTKIENPRYKPLREVRMYRFRKSLYMHIRVCVKITWSEPTLQTTLSHLGSYVTF